MVGFAGWTITLTRLLRTPSASLREPVRVRMEALGRGLKRWLSSVVGGFWFGAWCLLLTMRSGQPGLSSSPRLWPSRVLCGQQQFAEVLWWLTAGSQGQCVWTCQPRAKPESKPSFWVHPEGLPWENNGPKQNTQDIRCQETLLGLAVGCWTAISKKRGCLSKPHFEISCCVVTSCPGYRGCGANSPCHVGPLCLGQCGTWLLPTGGTVGSCPSWELRGPWGQQPGWGQEPAGTGRPGFPSLPCHNPAMRAWVAQLLPPCKPFVFL